jgi:hypothetical protein
MSTKAERWDLHRHLMAQGIDDRHVPTGFERCTCAWTPQPHYRALPKNGPTVDISGEPSRAACGVHFLGACDCHWVVDGIVAECGEAFQVEPAPTQYHPEIAAIRRRNHLPCDGS